MLNLILISIPLACIAFLAITTWQTYKSTPGTHLMSAFYDSWTILGARITAAVAAVAAILMQDPSIKDAIITAVPVQAAPLAPLAVSLLLLWARKHTIGKD